MAEKEQIVEGLTRWIHLSEEEGYMGVQKKLLALKEDMEERLMIMVSGEFNAGKSTFINAILGEELLTVDITPATAMITKLTYGEERKILAHQTDGSIKEYDWSWIESLTAERHGEGKAIREKLSYVEFQLPAVVLKKYTLLDSPGLTALHAHHTAITESFMERNEVGIWLFNAMNVGTASELDWLKKMHRLQIPAYGVVNAIDRLDEDENLDEFLEYNERRLRPLIDKLYGISAREILQGKLKADEELLQWGNEEAINELWRDIGPVEDRKIESFYRKLHLPLKEFRDQLIGTKAAFSFIGKSKDIYIFQKSTFPEFQKAAELYRFRVKEYENAYEEWAALVNENDHADAHVEKVLAKLGNPEHLAAMWKLEVRPLISSWHQMEKELIKERNWLSADKELLENKRILITKGKPGLSYKVKLSKEETLLAGRMQELNQKIQALNKKLPKIKKEILEFDHLIYKELQKHLLSRRKTLVLPKDYLEELIGIVNDWTGNIRREDLQRLQNHLISVKSFCSSIIPSIESHSPQVQKSEGYGRIALLLEELASIYSERDYWGFLNQLEEVLFPDLPEPKHSKEIYQLVKADIFQLELQTELSMQLAITKEQAAENARELAKRKVWASSGIILLIIFILTL